MNEPTLFQFTSHMEAADYKKYLYLTTFRKLNQLILSLTLLSIVGTFFICFLLHITSPVKIVWILLFIVLLFVSFLFLKLERQVKQLFPRDSVTSVKKDQVITIYDSFLTASNRMSEGVTKTKYSDFYEIYETTEYLILYFDKNLSSLIKKQDIPTDQYNDLILFLQSKLTNRYHTHF